MRLHRLRLSNVKGVVERSIDLPERGVIVLEGRNEIGKTSMLEALDLLIDEKDSSRKRHVLAARPVGQDVASSVEAELSSGPYRFTYRKQWFKQPGTTLTITRPRREHLTGVAAHERVQGILDATTDMGLWRALRFMQATPLNQCDLASSSALAAALDEAAGRAEPTAGAEVDTLLQSVQAEYRTYYTATGKPTGDYRAGAERVDDGRHSVQEARESVAEVEADVRRHAQLREESLRVGEDLGLAREEQSRLAEDWQQLAELLARREQADRVCAAAKSAADLHSERRDTRQALVDALSSRQAVAASAEVDAARLAEELGPHEAQLDNLIESRDEQAETVLACRHKAAATESDLALLVDLSDLAELEADIEHVQAAIERRAQARRESGRRPVTAATLEAVIGAHQAWQLALAEQRAASATMRITSLASGQQLTVAGEPLALEEGESLERSLEEVVELVIADAVVVRMEPEAGAGARADAVASARAQYDSALARAGAAGSDEARRLHEEHREAFAALEEAERDVTRVSLGRSIDELREQHESLAAHVAERLAQRDGAAPPADIEEQKAAFAQARSDEDASRERVDALDAQVRAVRDAVQLGLIRLARAEARRDSARADADAAGNKLRSARSRVCDESLEESVGEALQRSAEADRARREVVALLRGHDPEALRAHLSGAQAAVRDMSARYEETREELLAVEARLSFAGGQGRAERLSEAQAQQAHAEREFDSIDRRARAAALLHETFMRHRSEAARAYVEPFGQAITRLGRVVYGSDFDVEVDRGLCIEARVLDGERIDYAALSTGAKEQLAILTRLACASLVDAEQGAPVIIDDALGYSDPEKLRRVCSAFSLIGDDAQVLLLTCTPGRYASIPDAHLIRL